MDKSPTDCGQGDLLLKFAYVGRNAMLEVAQEPEKRNWSCSTTNDLKSSLQFELQLIKNLNAKNKLTSE